MTFAVVDRGGRVVLTRVFFELRFTQGVIVAVILTVILHDQVAAVAVAILVQRVHFELIGIITPLPAPFFGFSMRVREPVAKTVVLPGLQTSESFAEVMAAERLFDEAAKLL